MFALNTVGKINREVFWGKLGAGLSRGPASDVTSEVDDQYTAYNVGKH